MMYMKSAEHSQINLNAGSSWESLGEGKQHWAWSLFCILCTPQTLRVLCSSRVGGPRPDWNPRALSNRKLSYADFCPYPLLLV